MRVLLGAAQNGTLVAPAVLAGALALLTGAALTPGSAVQVAPFLALALAATLVHKRLLSWKTLLGTLLAIILFIPIRRYTMPGNMPFELEPYRVMIAFLGGGWFVAMLVDPRVRLRATGLEAPLLLFVFVALGSILVNIGRINALGVQEFVLKKLTFFISFFLVLYLVMSVVRTRELVDHLVKWLVAGGAVVAAFAIYESWTGYNVFSDLGRVLPILQLAYAPELDVRGSRLRVFASGQHPIAIGVAFVMLLPFSVYLYKRFEQRRWLLAGGIIVLACFSTVSRTTILMLIVVLITFRRLRPAATRGLWKVLLPAFVVIHLALPGAIGTLQESFFPSGGLVAEQQAGAGGRGSGRVADIGPSLEQWKRQPLLGQGFGTRVTDEGIYLNAFILDNQWLGTLLETGAIGVLSWFWLFRRFLRRVNQAAREDAGHRGWLLTALSASVLAYALAMATYDAWSFIQVTFLLFIMLGIGSVVLAQPADAPVVAAPRLGPLRRLLAAREQPAGPERQAPQALPPAELA